MENNEAQALERAAYISGLRELANFLEGHPAFPTPWDVNFYYRVGTKEEIVAALKDMGTAEKVFNRGQVQVKRKFGPHVLEVYADRDKG